MKNKKGFTLVELLAVIAILAILVIIAMPNILKRFNEAKKNSFVTDSNTVYKEVTSAYINNEISGKSKKTIYDSKTNDLDLDGNINYCVFTNTSGEINYMFVSNGSYYLTYDGTKNISKYTSNDLQELTADVETDCDKIGEKIKSGEIKTHKICHYEGELKEGTTFNDGVYTYKYKYKVDVNGFNGTSKWAEITDEDGWGVRISDENIESVSSAPCTILTNGEDNSSVVSVVGLYSNAKKLKSIDVSNFNTINITDMTDMFSLAGSEVEDSFTITGLENWDTRNVTNMSGMFWSTGMKAENWSIGDLSKWNTSKVTNMAAMFYMAAKNSLSFDVGNLNTKEVTIGTYKYLAWDTKNVTNMTAMFQDTSKFVYTTSTTWNIGEISNWNTSKVNYMNGMFCGAGKEATSFDIGDLNTKEVTVGSNKYTAWDTSNVTNMEGTFQSTAEYADFFYIGNISNWNTSNVTNMHGMFCRAGKNAPSFDIGDLSTKKVTVGSNKYTAWDTSNVTNMEATFKSTAELANFFHIGNISNWDTSNVTNMNEMFYLFGKLDTMLDLSLWKTDKVSNNDKFSYNSKTTIIEPTWP